MVARTSLCGLGQNAPNPVLSTLRFFRNEYLELLRPDSDERSAPWRALPARTRSLLTPMAAKTLIIDGRQVSAEDGATILDAAADAGIEIPTLCHLEGVYDVGACRLCLVEVAGVAEAPSRPARPASRRAWRSSTDTERLRKYRRMTLELLFAERNHVCAVCVSNGHCELQALAWQNGMDHVRYDYCFPKWGVDATHPLFGLDHNRCILCTRCVRVCWHIEGAGTKNVAGRGAKSRIIDDLNQPWGDSDTCTSCGKCVLACPTGALFNRGSTVARCRATAPSSNSSSTPGRKSNGSSKNSHSLARRLRRLPHVVPRPGRVPHRPGRRVDLVYSPIIDVKEYPEGVDVCLVEGAVCNQDNLEHAPQGPPAHQGARLVRRLRGDGQRARDPQPAGRGQRRERASVRVHRQRPGQSAAARRGGDRPGHPRSGPAGPRGRGGGRLPARLPALGATGSGSSSCASWRASRPNWRANSSSSAEPEANTMAKRIIIDPVTRIEGHAKISIHLDDAGEVTDAEFHVVEFRGFEKFCEGRPYSEMPGITARICGICPVSHLLASSRAGDAIMAVEIPVAADKLRRLMNLGQIVQSHALSFFHLSAPDFILGWDTPQPTRNVFGLIAADPQLARAGIRLRQFGQEIIEAVGGRKIHPAWSVPGGVRSGLSEEGRAQIRGWLPEAYATAKGAIALFKRAMEAHKQEILVFGNFPSLFMGLVSPDGTWEHHGGKLRFSDSLGRVVADQIEPSLYLDYIGESVNGSSYLKSPYYKALGLPGGMYRVGPLARLNICERMGVPARRRGASGVQADGPGRGHLLLPVPLRPADRSRRRHRAHRARARGP